MAKNSHFVDAESSIFSEVNKKAANNGFPNQQTESVYNTVICKLVSLLAVKCAELMQSASPLLSQSNEDFSVKMLKLMKLMKKLENER